MDIVTERNDWNRRRKRITIAVDITIWVSASIAAFYLFLYGKPNKSGFFCDDKSLSYPSVTELISTPVLVAVGIVVSILLVIFVEVFNYLDNRCRPTSQRVGGILYCVKSYIVFMIGFLVEELFVDAIKNKIGILRPNFFEVCQPKFNATLCPGYVSEYTCTGSDDKEIRSSRQSFPSGHSTFAMYVAIYLSIYIENRLQIKFSRLLKIFLQACLILVAILCGFGRIREHKHHPSDVIAGFILGTAVAVFVHNMLWKKFVKKTSTKETSTNINDTSRDYIRSNEQTSEHNQQTPSPLQNKYFSCAEKDRNSSSTKLLELQNDDNQNIVITSENI